MYAYVRFLEDNLCQVVPVENILNFRIDDTKMMTKKYSVKWDDGEYYTASIIYVKDSLTSLQAEIKSRRVKLLNKNLLETETDDTEDELHVTKNVRKNNSKKGSKVVNSQQAAIMEEYKDSPNNDGNNNNTVTELEVSNPQANTDCEANLKAEIVSLKQQLLEMSNLNIDLQKHVINLHKDLLEKLTIREVREEVAKANAIGEIVGENVHIGQGIMVSKECYDSAFSLSKNGSQFVKNMAIVVFGASVLKNSSVTGRTCNRTKNATAKPALNGTKLQAIQDIFRYYLEKKGTTPVLVDMNVAKTGQYIASKISDLNRVKTTTKSKENEETEENDAEDNIEDSYEEIN